MNRYTLLLACGFSEGKEGKFIDRKSKSIIKNLGEGFAVGFADC
jgi:hypothetical protein